MTYPPDIAAFKAYFPREFIYGTTLDKVTDADITRALNEAGLISNSSLWVTGDEQQTAYLLVAAHFLALNIQGAGGLSLTSTNAGLAASSGGGAIESKSVGGVSVSYALPDIVRQSPLLAQFYRTSFGQLFLALILPRLVGNMYLVAGRPEMFSNQMPIPGAYFGGTMLYPLKISTLSLTGASVGVPYSATLGATGGVAPLTWTVTGGSLPSPLTLTTGGFLAGTPASAATAFFTVTVSDAAGGATTQNLELVIS